MSSQLESRHSFRTGDTVRHWTGMSGEVLDARTLYATIRWANGEHAEVDQFDPAIVVVERAAGA